MTALPACRWCGFHHGPLCPTVRSIEFHADGVTVKKVEFHPPAISAGAYQPHWSDIKIGDKA